jgi:hypothetical protein
MDLGGQRRDDAASSGARRAATWRPRRLRLGDGRRPHDATYDVFAMAQLLQAVLAYSEDAGIDTVESLVRRQDASAGFRGG